PGRGPGRRVRAAGERPRRPPAPPQRVMGPRALAARLARRVATPLALLLLAAHPLAAQAPKDGEIAESQQRLEQIRRERARLRADLEKLRGTVTDISGELKNLERQVGAS